jgi:hypothetical protein
MKRIGTPASILITIGIGASAALASDVDWKVYGGVKFDVNDDATCFYDDRSVGRQPDGHIRVWTKCLPEKEIEDFDGKTEIGKKVIELTAQKVAHYYVPPFATIDETMDAGRAMQLTLAEEIADISYIQPTARIFYELNCSERMLRELSISIQISGKNNSSDTPGKWKYVSPEGNAANLLKILCPSR